MIDATGLTKTFGDKVAVDNLSFSVRSGMVTGFLGPNGAGKSTTMRLILGLDHPTEGHCRVNGRSYRYAKAPMTEVGALLEAKSVHPGRTARSHLRALAATHGIPTKRVDEVIELVGLGAVANKRAGDYSLGMSQRLGLAGALLGDPETLILDEPINGLDPEGVAWVRSLLTYLAEEGRTVFISSHLMSEMAMVADHIIIIGRGRLISDSPMSDLIERASGRVIKVRSPDAAQIREVVTRSGRTVTDADDGAILISGLSAEAVGKEATRRGWTLYELTPVQRSLEDIYMELTDSSQEFRTEGHFNELAHALPARLEEPPLDEEEDEDDEVVEDVDEEEEDDVEPAYVPSKRVEPHISRPASLDQRSEYRARAGFDSDPDLVKPRSFSSDPPVRPRLLDTNPPVRPRLLDPDVPTRSLRSDTDVPTRPRLLDPEPVSRTRSHSFDSPQRPRLSDPDPLVRPRVSGTDSARPRISDTDSARPRVSALDPARPFARPSPDPAPRAADPVRPRDHSIRQDHTPRRRDAEEPPASRGLGDTPRPRLSGTDAVRPRLPQPDPAVRPRLTGSDPSRPRPSDSARPSDPLPRPRFMDLDYRTLPRPTDSGLYRPKAPEPDPDKHETSADPLRLPRPAAGQYPRPRLEPNSTDSNRPRRAWGV